MHLTYLESAAYHQRTVRMEL